MEPYGIAVDRENRTLRVTLRGFWDMATVEKYLQDLKVAGGQVSFGGASSWWLIDIGKAQVQSREVAEAMRDRLPSIFPPATTVAVVIDTGLAAVQAKRVVPNPHHRHFVMSEEAERWLTEQGMPARKGA